MSDPTSIAGWLEGHPAFDLAIRRIVAEHRQDYEIGASGWKFNTALGFTGYWAFGAHMNSPAFRPWLRAQLDEIAALDPVDEDGERVRGFFLVRREIPPVMEWHIRDGSVTEVVHDGRLDFLDE